tara:strand:+ start:116 stop:460 length:345 start_codon:yes stop_codon:yes gene_type:complete
MDNVFEKKYFLISLSAIPAVLIRWQINDVFIVNIIGCFLLGFINAIQISKKIKLVIGFGFCGSLTTFSGLILKLFDTLSQGLYKFFFIYLILIVVIGFLAMYLGDCLAKKILRS